ncbi:exodeoxyribonuclease VII small subunit [Acidihalobacter ferrooxydans]|uniref:Exodeoxyribonuclease 7 small subunit n=1 Tax=Acidihalobacter ferrooxydans TaxID=1765967 RepID=A0A1P8ULK1_9GAMM|nr:exodeoxyribonuclease VII small subunit [Acidihalobacter ferrooxydans]APZ44709.1 exodeoxyribonuclease VII small subunit [Acidihalobacter ferrooxydans]
MSPKKLNFETALAELEALVERMEHGDQPLEVSLKEFEQGIRLVRDCQRALETAEQKIRLLTDDGEQPLEAQPSDEDETVHRE